MTMTPIRFVFLEHRHAQYGPIAAEFDAGNGKRIAVDVGLVAASCRRRVTTCFVSSTRAEAAATGGRVGLTVRGAAPRQMRAARCAARRHGSRSPSQSNRVPNLASQRRVAFSSMASNTGSSSPGELEMTCSTSEVAVCCSSASVSCFRASASRARRASARSRVRASSVLQSVLGIAPDGQRAFPPSFRSNEACDRAFGSSRPCETRSPPQHLDRPRLSWPPTSKT